jgi:ribosomal protein L7Ae-like RNA K-turn-binding protein
VAPQRGEQAALSLIGLALRAGRLEVGTHAVKEAARRGELHAVVLARDATENARNRVLPLLRATGVPVVTCESAAGLGRAAGRSRLVVVGVRDAGFAGRIVGALPPAPRAKSTEN